MPPGQNDFIDTQADQSQTNKILIETDPSSIDKNGKFDLDSLLEKKLQQDMKDVDMKSQQSA